MATHRRLCCQTQGIHVGKVCEKCDGRCLGCDSFVRLTEKARICDDCAWGSMLQKCLICQTDPATNDAYYCRHCVMLERERDGCPRIINYHSVYDDLKRRTQGGKTSTGAAGNKAS